MRRRMLVAALLLGTAMTTTGCKIPVPDGTIPGKTGCEIWWLEPRSPGPVGGPLDWFLLGSLVPLPWCDQDDAGTGA